MKEKDVGNTELLFEAILALETKEECLAFFEDILTINELRQMAQRMEVAALLDQGMSYNDIVNKTGASSTTVSRVNRCLVYGEEGYRTVLRRIATENKDKYISADNGKEL